MKDGVPFARVVLSAALAGLAAGLAVAIYHFVITEPIIEHAISIEAQLHPLENQAPLVSRDAQRVGLFVASALYGVTWGLLLSVFYEGARRWLPGLNVWQRAAVLSAASYWSLALFPFLKYPANPPGIGDPATIGYRQGLYIAVLVLSLLGTALAFAAARGNRRRWPWALLALVAFDVVAYVFLPPNPDPISIPLDLLRDFQVRSFIGLGLFWAILGLLFALNLRRRAAPPLDST